MEKLLDEIFCEYLLDKHIINKAVLAQIQEKKNVITIREALLLNKHINLSIYTSIINLIKNKKEIFDTKKSKQFDKKFIKYGLECSYFSKKDAEVCYKHSQTSPFTIREWLIVSSIIDYKTYVQIMNVLLSDHMDDISTKEQNEEKNIENLSKSQLSIVCDNSAETVIDISGDDPELVDDSENIETEHFGEKLNYNDDSVDTIVDQDLNIEDEPTLDIYENDVEATVDIQQPMDIRTSSRIDEDSLIDNRVSEKQQKTIKQSEIPTRHFGKDSYKDVMPYTNIDMDTIVREVQKQVNLQTQQMTHNFGQEISGYKNVYKRLTTIVIFVFLFLLAFTGWIEMQRIKNVNVLRKENKEITTEKENIWKKLVTNKTETKQIKEQYKSLETTKKDLENELNDAKEVKKQIKILENNHKVRVLMKESFAYLEIDALDKAEKKFREAFRRGKKDEQFCISAADYLMKKNNVTGAIQALRHCIKLNPNSWVAYLKLGKIYYNKFKFELAREAWEKALQNNPSLNEIKAKIKALPVRKK